MVPQELVQLESSVTIPNEVPQTSKFRHFGLLSRQGRTSSAFSRTHSAFELPLMVPVRWPVENPRMVIWRGFLRRVWGMKLLRNWPPASGNVSAGSAIIAANLALCDHGRKHSAFSQAEKRIGFQATENGRYVRRMPKRNPDRTTTICKS